MELVNDCMGRLRSITIEDRADTGMKTKVPPNDILLSLRGRIISFVSTCCTCQQNLRRFDHTTHTSLIVPPPVTQRLVLNSDYRSTV
jgi:hypothetical protein